MHLNLNPFEEIYMQQTYPVPTLFHVHGDFYGSPSCPWIFEKETSNFIYAPASFTPYAVNDIWQKVPYSFLPLEERNTVQARAFYIMINYDFFCKELGKRGRLYKNGDGLFTFVGAENLSLEKGKTRFPVARFRTTWTKTAPLFWRDPKLAPRRRAYGKSAEICSTLSPLWVVYLLEIFCNLSASSPTIYSYRGGEWAIIHVLPPESLEEDYW